MPKGINKPVLYFVAAAAIGGTLTLEACKKDKGNSDVKSTNATSSDLNKFDDMRDKLIKLNNDGNHSGNEKLDIMWNTIDATKQDPGKMNKPAGEDRRSHRLRSRHRPPLIGGFFGLRDKGPNSRCERRHS